MNSPTIATPRPLSINTRQAIDPPRFQLGHCFLRDFVQENLEKQKLVVGADDFCRSGHHCLLIRAVMDSFHGVVNIQRNRRQLQGTLITNR